MSDLKPCPFCGEAPYSDEETARIFGIKTCWNYAIACSHCESVGSCSETMLGAIDLWNTRHIPEGYVTRDEMNKAVIDAVSAARNRWAKSDRVLDGYTLVPIEPTDEMLKTVFRAPYNIYDKRGKDNAIGSYKAMIAAAQGELNNEYE